MRLIGAAGPYPVFAPVRRSTISCRCRCRYRAGQSVQLRNKSSSSSSSSSTVDSSSKAPASLASPRETTAAAENPPASTPSSAYQQVSTSASASSSGALNASTPRPLIQTIKLATIDKIAKAYGRAQDRRPYLTQVLSTLVVYLCGDLTAQLLLAGDNNEAQEAQAGEEEEKHAASTSTRYDPLRTIRHLSVGAVAALPVYKWFMFLENHFNFASRRLSIAIKVLISQCVFTPTFNAYFFSAQSLLAGASLEDTWERLQAVLPLSVVNSLKVWPAATAFSFAYVDPRFRSIFAGCIAIGWQSYLSYLNQRAAGQVDGHDATTGEREGVADAPATTGTVLQKRWS